MTNNIYPPDHLLRKWESLIIDEEQNVDVVLYEAFQAGADQELEACCVWLRGNDPYEHDYHQMLRAARRPKPPSLKEQALEAARRFYAKGHEDCTDEEIKEDFDTIRRALERLQELENND